MSSVSYKVGKIRDIYWLTVHRKSSTCALFFSTSFSISLSFCSWMLMQNSHFLTHFPMNSTIFFQFMRTGTSFPSRFMEKPEKHLCVFLFVFQILSDVVVFRLFSGPNGAKLITLNHKRLDKVHHLSQKHNAWDFVLFATDKLALKSLNELREKYTFFRKNNWEGGKNKTCWHQFLDGASGLQLKVGVGRRDTANWWDEVCQVANKPKSGHLVSLATPRRWNA